MAGDEVMSMDVVFLLLFGLAGLVLGGELLVRGAVDIARRAGLSALVIGVTLVGFGTSTPELVTSLQAAFAGSPGIAIGNVVGSNIANILLILGLTAALGAVTIERQAFRRDGTVLALATAICVAAVLHGRLETLIGIAFIAALAVYLWVTLASERKAVAVNAVASSDAPVAAPHGSLWRNLFFLVAGLAMTILGARMLVTGAIDLATGLGVSQTIIGLTIVAVGTSLPELVTSVIAVRKGQTDIAFGNIVGSNIFNILFILGATAIIHPINIPETIAALDIWVMVAATLFLLVVAGAKGRISRASGAILLGSYVAYTAWLVMRSAG
jgi:cation:H+ antiporter